MGVLRRTGGRGSRLIDYLALLPASAVGRGAEGDAVSTPSKAADATKLTLAVLAFVTLGELIRDALDPKARKK